MRWNRPIRSTTQASCCGTNSTTVFRGNPEEARRGARPEACTKPWKEDKPRLRLQPVQQPAALFLSVSPKTATIKGPGSRTHVGAVTSDPTPPQSGNPSPSQLRSHTGDLSPDPLQKAASLLPSAQGLPCPAPRAPAFPTASATSGTKETRSGEAALEAQTRAFSLAGPVTRKYFLGPLLVDCSSNQR